MEVCLVDVDALAHVVPATRVHISLLHVPHSERRIPEATYNYYCERAIVQNADGGCVSLGIHTYQLGNE